MKRLIIVVSVLVFSTIFLSANNAQETEMIVHDRIYGQKQVLQPNQKRDIHTLLSLLEDKTVGTSCEEQASFIDPYTGGGYFLVLVMFGMCVYPLIKVCCSRPVRDSGLTVLGDCCSCSLYDIENPESEY